MSREVCPECRKGYLYEGRDGQFKTKACFVCGYYWNDSEGYSELSKRLFKEYFPTQTKWPPTKLEQSQKQPDTEQNPQFRPSVY